MNKVFKADEFKERVEKLQKKSEEIIITKRLRGGRNKSTKGTITNIYDNYFMVKYPNYTDSIMYKQLYTREFVVESKTEFISKKQVAIETGTEAAM